MPVKGGAIGLDVGGVEFAIDPDSTKHGIKNAELSTIVGGRGRVGSTSKGIAPFIETKVYFDESQNAAAIDKQDVTVVLRLRDRTVSLSRADLVGTVEIDATDRGATVRFEGVEGRETLL